MMSSTSHDYVLMEAGLKRVELPMGRISLTSMSPCLIRVAGTGLSISQFGSGSESLGSSREGFSFDHHPPNL